MAAMVRADERVRQGFPLITLPGQTVGNTRNHYYRGLDRLRKQISASKLQGKDAV
jgi:hypothetical protein